ncbi:MAG: lysostaphin resistance A-like protein [Polyangiaceae bacterium]|jgi:membrane protease YdiL (CAAX protease family)
MQHEAAERAPQGPGHALEMLGTAAIVVFVGVASSMAFSASRAGEPSFWELAGGPVLALTPIALWWAWRRGELAAWMRPKAGDFSLGFLGAALLFGGAYAFSRIVAPGGSPRAIWLARLYLQLGDPNALRAHPMALFAGLVAVAAAEEIVWRGLVTSLLGQRLSRRWASAGSAALYGLAYVPTMWALAAPSGLNPLLPVAALACGLVWGEMATRFDRLTPSIVSHALFDWCIVVMFRLWGESL